MSADSPRATQLREILVEPEGLKQIVEIYREAFHSYPPIGASPVDMIDAIVRREVESQRRKSLSEFAHKLP